MKRLLSVRSLEVLASSASASQVNYVRSNRMLKTLPVTIALFLAIGSNARAQDWTKVSSPFVVSFTTPYFLNTNVGFTFNDGIIYDNDVSVLRLPSNGGYGLCLPELARTTNGGLTWSALNFFDTSGYSITQLSFVSLTHGYASAAKNYNINNGQALGGIFETFDQGSHWKKITPDGIAFSGVYASKHAIFASEATEAFIIGGWYTVEGAILYSLDDGATWDSITNVAGLTLGAKPQFQLISGNRDSLVATVYYTNSNSIWTKLNGYGDAYLVFSTDLGKTWNSTLLDQSYQWGMVSLHISPHSCNIAREFIVGKNGDDVDDTYSFLESSPPYVSWDTALSHRETSAWIAGTSCGSYLSDAADGQGPGDFDSSVLLFRSTDDGVSWNPILKERGNNPEFTEIDDYDWQNLSVVDYGAVIYACDNGHNEIGGSYWKSTDGGDGTLNAAALAPQLALAHASFPNGTDTLTISPCSPSQASVFYQNLQCAITKMDSIFLTGLDSNEYSLTSTHHNDCLSLPDTTFINFVPHKPGTYPITIHEHFTDDEYNTIDTSLFFTLILRPGGQPVPINLYFKSPTITTAAGDTLNIPIYLSGNTTLGSTSITLPFGIDTNVLRPIGFHSVISGLTNDTIIYSNGMVNVPLQSDSIVLNGETLIGYLRCIVYLADTLATTVTLQNASLTSMNAPCVALSLTTDSVNILINGCGDATLLQFMKTGQIPLAIQSIVPNLSPDAVQISFINSTSSPISYQVVDVLGTVRATGGVSGTALTLDIHSLPNGLYYLRARNVATGFVASGKFVVQR